MAGRLYRMAKVVSANPKSWGIVDANEISGFKRVAKLSDLYSIAECILSSSYGDGVTDGADAVGQIWHVSETNGDYKLINWANRKSAAGWTKLSYGGDVSVPVKDVKVDGTTVLSNGVANINLNSRLQNYATTAITNDLSDKIAKKADKTTVTELSATVDTIGGTVANHTVSISQINNTLKNKADSSTVTSLTNTVGDISTNFTNFKNSKGQANGLATLDAHGQVPLDQLGNLDMTVFTVVESLPTSNIENKVYLVRSSLTSDKNNYIEYIYTGDRKGTYDATKWEKLGEVAAKTDLSEYYKKTQVYNKTEIDTKVTNLNNSINNNAINTFTAVPYVAARPGEEHEDQYKLSINLKSGDVKTAYIKPATNNESGVMTSSQKIKLDGIAVNANNYVHPSYTSTPTKALYKINVDGHGHVSGYTAVNKGDLDSLITVDTVMSATSTNAVQNKVIDNAIKTHKINSDNLDGNLPGTGTDYNILGENNENNKVSALVDSFIYHFSPTGNSWLSIDGSTVWDDTSLRALTDTELNEILV